MSLSVDEFLASSCERIDTALDRALPPASEPPALLHEALRYAVFSGGKRLRPALAFGAAEAVGGRAEQALPIAIAVELIHAYSLVHDDLPALDDDAERRGRASVHVKFGEATAILVGDALQPAAFEALGAAGVPSGAVAALARAAGSRELVGGQVDDLSHRQESATLASITSIHTRKTAALFRFSTRWGAAAGGANDAECERLDRFGLHFGLAFQAADDLADAPQAPSERATDSDGEPAECSILHVLSASDTAARVEEQTSLALAALAASEDRAVPLMGLARALVGRLG
jgi:geranylgeranyl pyrophosphate synthase